LCQQARSGYAFFNGLRRLGGRLHRVRTGPSIPTSCNLCPELHVPIRPRLASRVLLEYSRVHRLVAPDRFSEAA
jgi:hypothetical protein